MIEISVEDNGPGLDPEAKRRVFTRFFTTKGSDGNGLGLGGFRFLGKHSPVLKNQVCELRRRKIDRHGAILFKSPFPPSLENRVPGFKGPRIPGFE